MARRDHSPLIGIVSGSLPDPVVQPLLRGTVVTPRPDVVTVPALRLIGAGEIDGTLMRAGGSSAKGGLRRVGESKSIAPAEYVRLITYKGNNLNK